MSSELTIEKGKTALVVIDLQKGISQMPAAPHSAASVIENASKLADACRRNSMPVFLVHVKISQEDALHPIADESWSRPSQPAPDWADIVPELGPKEKDVIITKKQWGAFYGTELELQLRRRGINTIILCGIATNYGVESTARFAYEFGFQQIFADDAMTSRSAEMHSASIDYALKRMGRVRSTQEILNAMRS